MKQICSNYSISGAAITLIGVSVTQDRILVISDATTGDLLYSFNGPTAVSYSQNGGNSTITTSPAPGGNSDKLVIFYDDGVPMTNATGTPILMQVSSVGGVQYIQYRYATDALWTNLMTTASLASAGVTSSSIISALGYTPASTQLATALALAL
jgi:hypothetical protein